MSFFDPSTDFPAVHHVWMSDDDAEYVHQPSIREIVGANLKALMAAHPKLDTNEKLFARAGVPVSTLSRIKNAQVAPTIDMLDRIAPVFDLQAWQLLVPGLDPSNLPVLRKASETEEGLYKKLRELVAERSPVEGGEK